MAHALEKDRLSGSVAEPGIRRIRTSDLEAALRAGTDDFRASPTQMFFLGVLYPVVGLVAARAMAGGDLLPLLWPMIAGLSLMGPVAAVGLYEISRRREMGEQTSWATAFAVLRHPNIGAVAGLGVLLMAILVAWLFVARWIFDATLAHRLAPGAGMSISDLVHTTFTTPEGQQLLLLGNGVGFLFAVAVLVLTVVSVPMLLDRNVSLGTAMQTSIRACMANPATMALWGLTVAVLLFLGCLPAFIGLAVVMPVLGHATWHLYRRVVT